MSNSLDLGPNCLQRLSADDTRRQSVLHSHSCMQHMYLVGLQVYSAVAQLVDWRSKGGWF